MRVNFKSTCELCKTPKRLTGEVHGGWCIDAETHSPRDCDYCKALEDNKLPSHLNALRVYDEFTKLRDKTQKINGKLRLMDHQGEEALALKWDIVALLELE